MPCGIHGCHSAIATVTAREDAVITDSVPWKDGLIRVADRLGARAHQQRWTERTSYLVEETSS